MTEDSPYRIWTRYRTRVIRVPSGQVTDDQWQQYPGLFVNERQAQQAAEDYQRNEPLREFVVLPEGKAPDA